MSSKDLIKAVESEMECRVLVLYYNAEDPSFLTQLAMDVQPCLRAALSRMHMEKTKSPLGLLLQSGGGILESPWPIVSGIRAALRSHKNEFWVVVNDKALSAATLIAISADKLFMSPFASLGPIDPQVNLTPAPNVRIGAGIEDILGYYDLMKQLFETDHAARVQAFSLLAQRIPPEILGQVARIHELIKLLARKMVGSRNEPPKKELTEKLITALTKDFFSHNYQISQIECRQLGLPVEDFSDDALLAVEALSDHYRSELEIGKDLTIDIPANETQAKVIKKRAFVESMESSFTFASEVIVNRDKTAQLTDLGWREALP